MDGNNEGEDRSYTLGSGSVVDLVVKAKGMADLCLSFRSVNLGRIG